MRIEGPVTAPTQADVGNQNPDTFAVKVLEKGYALRISCPSQLP